MLGHGPEGLEELCEVCHLMCQRGLTFSVDGNASLRLDDRVYITPTGSALGLLRTEEMVQTTLDGQVIGPGQPSKELGMHLAMYRARPDARAVLHPHPPATVAYSARYPVPRADSVPATNSGFYAHAGQIPLLPYLRSGSHELHDAVAYLAADFHVILLGNHGLMVAAPTLFETLNIVEEVEQDCQIALLAGQGARWLTPAQCREIDALRGRTWPGPTKYADWFARLAQQMDRA
jgi:3-dehydro-4-phosphotetronate decarboxylase